MQDPNSLRTYLPPDSFWTSTIVFFAYCLPSLTVETAIVTGFPSEDGRPVVLSLTRRPSRFYRPSSMLSRNLFPNGPYLRTLPFVWSMTRRIFDGHFFSEYKLICKFINSLYLEYIDGKTCTDA